MLRHIFLCNHPASKYIWSSSPQVAWLHKNEIFSLGLKVLFYCFFHDQSSFQEQFPQCWFCGCAMYAELSEHVAASGLTDCTSSTLLCHLYIFLPIHNLSFLWLMHLLLCWSVVIFPQISIAFTPSDRKNQITDCSSLVHSPSAATMLSLSHYHHYSNKDNKNIIVEEKKVLIVYICQFN